MTRVKDSSGRAPGQRRAPEHSNASVSLSTESQNQLTVSARAAAGSSAFHTAPRSNGSRKLKLLATGKLPPVVHVPCRESWTPRYLLAVGRLPAIRRSPARVFMDEQGRTWTQSRSGASYRLAALPEGKKATPLEAALLRIADGKWVVTPDGKIRSVSENRNLGTLTPTGYVRLTVYVDGVACSVFAHRVLAACYFGPYAETMTVHHRDHNRSNNRRSNLQVMPREENSREAALRRWRRLRSH